MEGNLRLGIHRRQNRHTCWRGLNGRRLPTHSRVMPKRSLGGDLLRARYIERIQSNGRGVRREACSRISITHLTRVQVLQRRVRRDVSKRLALSMGASRHVKQRLGVLAH